MAVAWYSAPMWRPRLSLEAPLSVPDLGVLHFPDTADLHLGHTHTGACIGIRFPLTCPLTIMYRPFLIDTISAHAMDHRIVKPTIALVGGLLTSLW